MDIAKKAVNNILKGFAEGRPADKIALGLMAPLWVPALLVSGTVEGVVDVAKGAVESVGKIAGTVGDTNIQKIKRLESLQGSLNPKGAEIQVEFEGGTYKFDRAIALLKMLPDDDPSAMVLYKAIAKAISENQ